MRSKPRKVDAAADGGVMTNAEGETQHSIHVFHVRGRCWVKHLNFFTNVVEVCIDSGLLKEM